MFNKPYVLLSVVFLLASLYTQQVSANEQQPLFFIDSTAESKYEETTPNNQPIKEWVLTFNLNSVKANSRGFTLQLPVTDEMNKQWQVRRTHFKSYQSGNTQWGGKIKSDNEAVGNILINVIDDMPFGVIKINDKTYNIHSDYLTGTRLIQFNEAASIDDQVYTDVDAFVKGLKASDEVKDYSKASLLSTVDVLVLVDDDLQSPSSGILGKINTEFVNANRILTNTKINAANQTGIPLALNHVGTQYIDIPDEFENIIDVNSNPNFFVSLAYNHLTNETSAASAAIKGELKASGADYVVVFVPFDPDDSSSEFCGLATLGKPATDLSFKTSVVLMADSCNENQFVLLHELLHSFGSKHLPADDDGYTPYASGLDIIAANPNDSFSTLMGCTTSGSYDPSMTNCGRIEQLSSPLVTINGAPVGIVDVADNVRFLSECGGKSGPCRRDDIATRNTRLPTNDFIPGITVTSHKDNDMFPVSQAFELTANVYDDVQINSLTWEIQRAQLSGFQVVPVPGVQPEVAVISSPDYSYTTGYMDVASYYIITATVQDSAGQTTTVEDVVIAQGTLPDMPVISSGNAGCGHNYCIYLEGTDFGNNPVVEVRENLSGSPVLEAYSGNYIHGQGVNSSNGNDFVRFPIVSVDQQTKFRNNGLCFILKDGSLTSNEVCFVRPATNPQGLFMGSAVESYNATQDPEFDAYIVKTAGTVLKIWGNSWKKTAESYTITPNTVLQFDFKSTHQEGEIAGIGFVMNGSGISLGQRFWQVHGTQNYGIQDYHNYTGNGIVTYKIPVGQYVTGNISHMIFASDDDNVRAGQANLFISPTLYEEEIDTYDNVPTGRAYSDDVPGDSVPINAGATAQTHNFHDQGDSDWTIFVMQNNGGVDIRTTQLGLASAQMIAYRVDGAYAQIAPGRWNITQSDLTHVADDFSTGNNYINIENTTGSTQAYVIRTFSSGPSGNNTNYTIRMTANPINVDAYDDVPSSRAYSDDLPGDAVPIAGNAPAQTHNFHDFGDGDWTIFSMPSGSGFDARTTQLGSASAQMIAYRVDGAFTETSPGRWDITQSDLTHIADDFSTGNNKITIQNTTGSIQAYVIRTFSSDPAGSNTDYTIRITSNNP